MLIVDNQIAESKTKSPVPFISIIIPAKNEERLIEQCLNALNALDYPRNSYEVIVGVVKDAVHHREVTL